MSPVIWIVSLIGFGQAGHFRSCTILYDKEVLTMQEGSPKLGSQKPLGKPIIGNEHIRIPERTGMDDSLSRRLNVC
jgi:hypothetical protein